MFLEAQFGPQIAPITRPKLAAGLSHASGNGDPIKQEASEELDMDEAEAERADLEAEELERLHSMGIPVPGVAITVDKYVAKVWLETLEVECTYGVLRDRVKAVVERAVETVAPLWGQGKR